VGAVAREGRVGAEPVAAGRRGQVEPGVGVDRDQVDDVGGGAGRVRFAGLGVRRELAVVRDRLPVDAVADVVCQHVGVAVAADQHRHPVAGQAAVPREEDASGRSGVRLHEGPGREHALAVVRVAHLDAVDPAVLGGDQERSAQRPVLGAGGRTGNSVVTARASVVTATPRCLRPRAIRPRYRRPHVDP
jgi:hypothetical protein